MNPIWWVLSSPLAILAGSALALLAVAHIVLRGRVRWLVIGEDNRYSNSKMQMVVWFWTLICSYLAALFCRWQVGGPDLVGGVNVPENLLMLSGLSALTFAGAKQISTSNEVRAHSLGLTGKPVNRFGPRLLPDLLNDDSGHRPDLGDFQMLVVTVLAVSVVSVQDHGVAGRGTNRGRGLPARRRFNNSRHVRSRSGRLPRQEVCRGQTGRTHVGTHP